MEYIYNGTLPNLSLGANRILEDARKMFDEGGLTYNRKGAVIVNLLPAQDAMWREWIILFDLAPSLLSRAPAGKQTQYRGLSDNQILTAPSLSLELGLSRNITEEVCDIAWREYVRHYRAAVIGRSDQPSQSTTLEQLISFGSGYIQPSNSKKPPKSFPQIFQHNRTVAGVNTQQTPGSNANPRSASSVYRNPLSDATSKPAATHNCQNPAQSTGFQSPTGHSYGPWPLPTGQSKENRRLAVPSTRTAPSMTTMPPNTST